MSVWQFLDRNLGAFLVVWVVTAFFAFASCAVVYSKTTQPAPRECADGGGR